MARGDCQVLEINFPDTKLLLKSFQGRIAKWRYQTLPEAMESLLKLRELCETWLKFPEHIFPNFQDGALLRRVKEACNWAEFWMFLDVAYELVLAPMERLRRWGLKCPCCDLARYLQKKRPGCPNAGRRLHQAKQKVAETLQGMTMSLETIWERSNGVPFVFNDVSLMLRRVIYDMTAKFAYLGSIPYLVVLACDPVVAKECARQLRTADFEKLDGLSKHFFRTLLPSLDLRGNGGEVDEILEKEISKLADTSIDESAGEEYHRRTHLTIMRAAASKNVWVLASTRFKQNLNLCKRFAFNLGVPGRRVFNYEWRNYTRLLRVDANKKARLRRPKNVRKTMFF